MLLSSFVILYIGNCYLVDQIIKLGIICKGVKDVILFCIVFLKQFVDVIDRNFFSFCNEEGVCRIMIFFDLEIYKVVFKG